MYKRCSGIRGKLKDDSKFKCQTCANQRIDIAEHCQSKELNGQSLEIVERKCLSSPCRTFKVSGIFSSGRPKKTWNEAVRRDLKGKSTGTYLTTEILGSLS